MVTQGNLSDTPLLDRPLPLDPDAWADLAEYFPGSNVTDGPYGYSDFVFDEICGWEPLWHEGPEYDQHWPLATFLRDNETRVAYDATRTNQ